MTGYGRERPEPAWCPRPTFPKGAQGRQVANTEAQQVPPCFQSRHDFHGQSNRELSGTERILNLPMGLGRHPTIGNLSKEHLPAMETVTIPSYGRLDGLRDGLALERHGDHPGDSLISQGAFGIGEQEYRRPPGEQHPRKR